MKSIELHVALLCGGYTVQGQPPVAGSCVSALREKSKALPVDEEREDGQDEDRIGCHRVRRQMEVNADVVDRGGLGGPCQVLVVGDGWLAFGYVSSASCPLHLRSCPGGP